MSTLAGLSRRSGLVAGTARVPAIASASNGVSVLQKRHRFTPAAKSGGGQSGEGSSKKELKLGAFQAMPTNKLSHPLFQSDQRHVLNLPTFGKDGLHVGDAMAFPYNENDAMRKFGLPKSMLLEFRLLSRACSIVREVTNDTLQLLDAASKQPSSSTRAVLTGPSGCGKSYLLVQALEHCSQQGWVVLYVPRAINLVNSSTTYSYDMRTQIYLQPAFAAQTLARLLTVNSTILKNMKTANEVPIERRQPLPAGSSVESLINIGIQDESVAPTVLEAVMAELGSQKQHPVLLAVDDFQALYCTSTYKDPLFSRIRPWHLSMPRLFLEYASGMRSFARGAVLGAISTQNSQFSMPLELRESLGLAHDRPIGDRKPRNKAILDYSRGLRNIAVPPALSTDEAAALFELWMKDRALYGVTEKDSSVSDAEFLAKYTESSGNARNFVQKGLLSSLAYTGGN